MGAFERPTQVLPIVLTSTHRLYNRKMPRRCFILHLVRHHLLDLFGCQRSQCHFRRVAQQVVFALAT
jgi:hypothetical protein